MEQEVKAALAAQAKLLAQIAADVAAIKVAVSRNAKPLTQAQQVAEVEAAARKVSASRTPKG